ncbi:DNA polymerase III subunit delta [Pseudarthrobacter sp. J1738]|uniref:DNA polymerase III subunit delta n=1 Tax=Pseudarthrobacter sp. J1738 TaxID=3420446 RepID=UPI003D27E405
MAAARTTRTTGATSSGLSWREATPAPVVLVLGPEEYFGSRAKDLIRGAVRSKSPDVELTRMDASTYTVGQLLMTASPSLFGEDKLIEVDSLESMNEAFLADALTYVASPSEDTVVVLRHAGGTRGKKVLDAIKASGFPVFDCQPLKKDSDKLQFVLSEFKNAARRIASDAAQALVDALGANATELASACTQLIADTDGAITVETVEKYYGGRVEASAFKVADAAMAGNAPLALSTLRHAFATGVDPVPLVAALAAKLRTIAKVAGSQGSSAAIARQLGMQPWLVEQAQREVRRWTPEGLVRSIKVVAEADAQVKGLSKDPLYAVENAVSVIAGSVSPR